jgi:predicted transposase YdaD
MGTERPSDIIPENLKLTHDGYFQETFKEHRVAQAILKKVLPQKAVASLKLEELSVDDRTISDDMFKEKSADIIYQAPIKGTKKNIHFFAVLEHKSRQDFQTVFQLWGYVYRICLREFQAAEQRGENMATYRHPPIVAIIVHHGAAKFKGATELAEMFVPTPGLEQHFPGLRAILFDLSNIDDDDPILNDPEVPELKVVLMVLKVVFRKDVVMKVADVLQALKPHSDDPATRRLIRTTWVYLMNNARHLRKQNFGTFINTFKEITGDEDMPTMVEVLIAEGREEGRAEGKIRGKIEMVLKALRKKFKQIPQEIENAVLSRSDPIALESLLEHVIDSDTLDEFTTGL